MPRTTLTAVSMVAEAGADVSSPTTVDATLVTNGAQIAYTAGRIPKLAIHIKNTFAGAKNLTIPASDFGQARDAGDLVVSVASTTGEQLIVPNESRHGQSNGYVYVDFESSMTGSIIVYELAV